MNRNNKKFKKDVLDAFKKVSPSKIKIENEEVFNKYLSHHINLFFWKLHFPISLFDGKKIIDFGCGTGELDIILNKWGALVNGFDFNNDSIKRAKKIRDKFNIDKKYLKFEIGDIDSFKIKRCSYDLAVSFGVIAHVPNQKRIFERMANSTKPGGFIILGYVEDSGLIQRLLHRAISRANSKISEAEIYEIALKMFGEHIKRSVKYGNRTAQSVINDYLINPAYFGISCKKLDDWAEEFGLKFYSSWPNTDLPFVVDSPYFETISRTSSIYKTFLSLHRLRYIFAQCSDLDVFSDFFSKFEKLEEYIEEGIETLNSMLQNNIMSNIYLKKQKKQWNIILNEIRKISESNLDYIMDLLESTLQELLRILDMIVQKVQNDEEFDLSQIKYLFHGYNGLGTTYTIYHKK